MSFYWFKTLLKFRHNFFNPDRKAVKVFVFSCYRWVFLKGWQIWKLYLFDCFILNASSVDDAKIEIMLAWGETGGSILYIVSDKKKEFFLKLSNCSWLIIVLSEYHKTYFSPMTKASVSRCFVWLWIYKTGFCGKYYLFILL